MLYINDFCGFAAGGTIKKDSKHELSIVENEMVYAQEPDYKDLIPPMQLRRMSKPIRLSIAAIKMMLQNKQTDRPVGAINVGTALGLLSDSEAFLSQMVKQEEQMLTPTYFIQSTQNTIGGQIALLLKCQAHNMTFTQRGHSFEHALLDIDLLSDKESDLIVGGVDEMTPHYYIILNRLMWSHNRTSKDIDQSEGAGFFLMSKEKRPDTLCAINSYTTFKSKDVAEIVTKIKQFFEDQNIATVDEYNWIIGDHQVNEWDTAYQILLDELKVNDAKTFKQYTSNFATVGALGLAFAINDLLYSTKKKTIYINNYLKYWSIFILER